MDDAEADWDDWDGCEREIESVEDFIERSLHRDQLGWNNVRRNSQVGYFASLF